MVDELVAEVGQGLGAQSGLTDAGQLVGLGKFLVESSDQVGEADAEWTRASILS
ncbi:MULTISPECIES: hypothetical protein [unclassified Streptomyces]|uniref:hypothetical protein n=1 Tax=unclassified Streptomyces TaxID=2593676 RepID=UPI0013B93EB1|nr:MULTISPECIES: hypothetical protein [unclassified Streptomyces]NEB33491.1 hypothetical protein [Streptomyces sp. SID14446]WSD75115.1 hypothetical protein OHB33_01750 [Streptomyces sp. NBC_01558]WSK58527.1 hypothetical protein OG458_00735 [Streptomyces sp. NBC_01281]